MNRAENKQIKMDALKAIRNDSKKNCSVIAKSIQNVIQLSRNNAFRSESMKMLKIYNPGEIGVKILELLED